MGARIYINNRSPHAQFLSTHRSVRLHRKPSIIFQTGTRWKRTDFCTNDHHFGITHGRKLVSPSRTPCDSDLFRVAIHKSSFAFMGARTDTLQWGQIPCSLLYLLLSIESLEQFWNVIALELRASFSARKSSFRFFKWLFGFTWLVPSYNKYRTAVSNHK